MPNRVVPILGWAAVVVFAAFAVLGWKHRRDHTVVRVELKGNGWVAAPGDSFLMPLDLYGPADTTLKRAPRGPRPSLSASDETVVLSEGAWPLVTLVARTPGRTVLRLHQSPNADSFMVRVVGKAEGAHATPVDAVSPGGSVCALRGGTALCWDDPRYTFLVEPPGDGGGRWRQISAGTHSACGLDARGAAWCWAFEGYSNDAFPRRPWRPTRVRGELRFASLSATYWHACALTGAGEAWCWGSGGIPTGPPHPDRTDERLGSQRVSACYDMARCNEAPTRVESQVRFQHVTTGGEHTCALSVHGEVWCWGDNRQFQLGQRTAVRRDNNVGFSTRSGWSFAPSARPVRVPLPGRYLQVSAGLRRTCAVRSDGDAWCWGGNMDPRREWPDTAAAYVRQAAPQSVEAGVPLRSVAVGDDVACAVARDGKALCWGRSEKGALGAGDAASRCYPGDSVNVQYRCADDPVQVVSEVRFRTVAVQRQRVCAQARADGGVYCWGEGVSRGREQSYGGRDSHRPIPILLP